MTNQDNDEIQKVIKEELDDLIHIADISSLNINRTLRLLKESIKLADQSPDKQAFLKYIYDIVRAAVVFLHASLEMTLREILRLKLKHDADISHIPLSDYTGTQIRKEKFNLQDLAKHRGETVDAVIDSSIDQYLTSLSFNSTNDIADGFSKVGLPHQTLQQYYSVLNEMITRRHRIVHEGDTQRTVKPPELIPIDMNDVITWIDTTANFNAEAIRIILNKVYFERISNRLEKEGMQVTKEQLTQWINVTVGDSFK